MVDKKTLSKEEKKPLIKKISQLLDEKEDIIFAYIYGSFVSSSSFQDIDIGVFIKEVSISPLSLELEMERDIENCVHIPTDVRIINNAPLSFIFNILKDGKVIIDHDSNLRADFEGIVYKKYFDFEHLRNEYLREILNAPI